MRDRYTFRQDCLDPSGHGRFISRGIALTVLKDTRKKYTTAFRRFVVFLVKEKRPMSLDSFSAFLQACRTQGAKGETLEGYRSGVLLIQRAHGLEPFAADARLQRAIKGYGYADKIAGVPRGAITEVMLRQFWTIHREFARMTGVVFYAVLRSGQAARYRAGDFVVGPDGRATLTVRTDKRRNAGNNVEEISTKEIVAPAAKALLLAAARGKPHGALVFPEFDGRRMSELIRAAATSCGWPAGLEYDGLHCLRHGGAQHVRALVEAVLARMGDPCAMSPQTAAWYSRLNAIRTAVTQVIENPDDHEGDDENANE